jgi:hypothetical protein
MSYRALSSYLALEPYCGMARVRPGCPCGRWDVLIERLASQSSCVNSLECDPPLKNRTQYVPFWAVCWLPYITRHVIVL